MHSDMQSSDSQNKEQTNDITPFVSSGAVTADGNLHACDDIVENFYIVLAIIKQFTL